MFQTKSLYGGATKAIQGIYSGARYVYFTPPFFNTICLRTGNVAQNGFLQLGPENSCGELQICQTHNNDIARRHLAVTIPNDSRLYLHVVERDSPLLTGALELTWETTPDESPSGNFVWQGNRLAWRTTDESYLDGFFIGSSIGEAHRVYLNAVAYGMVIYPNQNTDAIG
jgi:hypothetical protein